jgi:hypothetical protein
MCDRMQKYNIVTNIGELGIVFFHKANYTDWATAADRQINANFYG